jgi:hypothetical protein
MTDQRETRDRRDAVGAHNLLGLVLGILVAFTVGRAIHPLVAEWDFGSVLAATVGIGFGLLIMTAVQEQD